ncbi:TetR/AcrR family transcriptional regulator [Nocardia amamiensis]|uniref:TetR/AcrR family transcriptional regulator n=1 Tax=Nocardia amamiensis TaxID=404578 RepID=UPI00082D7527|nr:TetR/AcrR family transcriptional regulator [Nocardia amamiensis]
MTATSPTRCDSTDITVPPLRAERQKLTQRLLHAATELMLTHGYTATSIDRIAEHAGCTRGTFFAHFGHKQQIGHEVADTMARHAIQRIRRFQPCHGDHVVATLATWASILVRRPGWIRLELDLADLDPASRTQTNQRLNHLRDTIRDMLATATATAPPDSSVDLDVTISFLLSVLVGMATQHTHNLGMPQTAIRPHIALVLRTAGIG